MLRRPSKKLSQSSEAYRMRQQDVEVSQKIGDLALKMNVMGSREGSAMLLQATGAKLIFDDQGMSFSFKVDASL